MGNVPTAVASPCCSREATPPTSLIHHQDARLASPYQQQPSTPMSCASTAAREAMLYECSDCVQQAQLCRSMRESRFPLRMRDAGTRQ
jgi:hypothetical protein